ncbi:MAG: toprim domain-containing protein, partial [Alistipes sp.]|nr:toprim domain-containing protein [Alistipes sp.]
NLSKAEQLLRPYSRIGSFLDNDQAGQKAVESLKKMFGDRLRDMSKHYAEHKDLNDYLRHRIQAKQAVKKSQVQSARRMPQPQPKKKRGLKNLI